MLEINAKDKNKAKEIGRVKEVDGLDQVARAGLSERKTCEQSSKEVIKVQRRLPGTR